MRVIIWLSHAALITATQCTVDRGASSPSPTTPVPAKTALISSPPDMTIAITNRYGSRLSLSFGLDVGSPPPYGNPQATELAHASSTQYVFPDEWAGRVAVGPNLNPCGSKIEGSFKNSSADIDVSYVDGFTVPITCSSDGEPVTGCNIDLFKMPCDNTVKGPVCLNPAREFPDGPPSPFFAPCAGAAYTFPNDNGANRYGLSNNLISCCLGTSCPAPSRQLFNGTI